MNDSASVHIGRAERIACILSAHLDGPSVKEAFQEFQIQREAEDVGFCEGLHGSCTAFEQARTIWVCHDDGKYVKPVMQSSAHAFFLVKRRSVMRLQGQRRTSLLCQDAYAVWRVASISSSRRDDGSEQQRGTVAQLVRGQHTRGSLYITLPPHRRTESSVWTATGRVDPLNL